MMADSERVEKFIEALAQLRRLEPILEEIRGEWQRAAEAAHPRRDDIVTRAAAAIGGVRAELRKLALV